MTVKRDIAFSIIANARDFQKTMAELPGITDKEASKAALRLSTQMEKGFKKSGKDAKKSGRLIGRALSTGMGVALAGIASSLARALSPGHFITASKEAADFTNKIQDMATATGISSSTLTGLQFMVRASGQELENIKPGIARFAKSMYDASQGIGEAAIGFDILGVEVRDQDGNMREMNSVFEESIQKLIRMEEGQKKTLAATTVFGKSGGNLVVALQSVNMSVDDATKMIAAYGLGTQEAIEAAAEWQKMTAHYEMFSAGVKTAIMEQIIPYIQEYADEIASLASITAAIFLGMTDVIATFAISAAQAFEGEMPTIAKNFADVQKVTGRIAVDMDEALGKLADGLSRGTVSVGEYKAANVSAAESQEELKTKTEKTTKANDDLNKSLEANRQAASTLRDMNIELAEGFERLELEETKAITAALALVTAGADWANVAPIVEAIEEKYRKLREELEKTNDEAGKGTEITKTAAEQFEEDANAILEVQQGIADAMNAGAEGFADFIQLDIDKTGELIQENRALISERLSQIEMLKKKKKLADGAEAKDIQNRINLLEGEVDRRRKANIVRKGEILSMYRGQQAAAISQAVMNGSVAIMRAFADLGPVLGALATAGITASTYAQVEQIKRQPMPTFHSGGFVDEVPAVLRRGEAVLNQGATNALGKDAIESLNSGGTATPMVMNFHVGGKLLESMVVDAMNNGIGNRAIKPGGIAVGVINPYVGR